MVKVGDKVVVVSAQEGDGARVGDVLTVNELPHGMGFRAESLDGLRHYVKMDGVLSASTIIVRPYTETEAEKRGAKFGVMGVNKVTGHKVTFVTENCGVNSLGEILWEFLDNDTNKTVQIHPGNVRLDHEPEFVAWADTPERLKYDASRVYCDGKPVKWIAKPEGAWSNVAFVNHYGFVQGSPDDLTVKL